MRACRISEKKRRAKKSPLYKLEETSELPRNPSFFLYFIIQEIPFSLCPLEITMKSVSEQSALYSPASLHGRSIIRLLCRNQKDKIPYVLMYN